MSGAFDSTICAYGAGAMTGDLGHPARRRPPPRARSPRARYPGRRATAAGRCLGAEAGSIDGHRRHDRRAGTERGIRRCGRWMSRGHRGKATARAARPRDAVLPTTSACVPGRGTHAATGREPSAGLAAAVLGERTGVFRRVAGFRADRARSQGASGAALPERPVLIDAHRAMDADPTLAIGAMSCRPRRAWRWPRRSSAACGCRGVGGGRRRDARREPGGRDQQSLRLSSRKPAGVTTRSPGIWATSEASCLKQAVMFDTRWGEG